MDIGITPAPKASVINPILGGGNNNNISSLILLVIGGIAIAGASILYFKRKHN